jgi:hypothetical protein
MISGTLARRRRVLAWSALASLILNVTILIVVLRIAPRIFGEPHTPEKVSATTLIRMEKPAATPPPAAQPAKPVVTHALPPPPAAAPPIHDLSHDDVHAPPAPPAPRHPSTIESRIVADQRGFADTVAKLNAANDPHAIATIDPGTQESASKSYGFRAPGAASEGNGIITPSQDWHEHGEDCYYAHYEYTYPDGAEETGNIVWPVCFDPGADPFKQGRHQMPFPLPLAGYRLPPGTDLPPIERDVYAQWISQQ